MVGKDSLLDPLELDILSWEELLEGEEARLVLGLVVVPVLDLTLERSKLDGLVTSARVSPVNYGVPRLDVEKVELDGIITINVLIRKEELLSKSEDDRLLDALFSEGLLSVQPVH